MKINQPGAHLDHLLRQTRMHQVQLSSMADFKANILLTMSSVVMTLSVPHVFKPDYRWAFISFGTFLAVKKYRFLRLAYLAFIIGILASFAMILLAGARN